MDRVTIADAEITRSVTNCLVERNAALIDDEHKTSFIGLQVCYVKVINCDLTNFPAAFFAFAIQITINDNVKNYLAYRLCCHAQIDVK